jgi:anti-sigma regulatory factor (Ser/Thr protein kinase)
MPETINRDFRADADGLADLDDWIERSTAGWRCGASLMRARVCAVELAANLMEHGSGRTSAALLNVRLWPEAGGMRLELTDDGAAFDPTLPRPAPAPATLETAAIGGRGLRTVRGLARELRYRRENGRNHVSVLVAD